MLCCTRPISFVPAHAQALGTLTLDNQNIHGAIVSEKSAGGGGGGRIAIYGETHAFTGAMLVAGGRLL
jgi:hypothetical protein